MNIKTDAQRGRNSARLANGATLYDNTDDSHVKRTTDVETKMRRVKAASSESIRTTRKRANKEVKPI